MCPECHQVIVPSEDVVLAARHKAAAALSGQETPKLGAHALFHPECWTRAAPEVWQLVDQKVRAMDLVEE
jgi:hypothetical protein